MRRSSICSRPRCHDDRRDAETPCLGDAVARDLHRIALTLVEDRQVDLLAERLELIDRGGSIDVGRDEQRAAPCSLRRNASFPACVVLPELAADQDVHGRRSVAVGQARRRAAISSTSSSWTSLTTVCAA